MLTTSGMMDITLSILALIAGGVTLELFTTARPKMNHRDESGLNLGTATDEMAADFPTGNPS
jgi:hypothetical protein